MNGQSGGAAATVVAAAPPARNAQKKKDKKKEPGKGPANKGAAGKTPARAIGGGSALAQKQGSDQPSDRFLYVLGPEEKALHDWLRCVFDPRQHSARVPLSRGGFELWTQLWRTFESGTFVAGTNGGALLGLCCANWVENANQDGVPAAFSQVLGYTGGGPAVIKSSDPTVAYGALPPIGVNYSGYFTGIDLKRPTDTPLTANTRIRLVAVELRIHSVEAQLTSKGEILVVMSVNPAGGAGAGTLNNATWDDVADMNDKVVTRAVRPISSFANGQFTTVVAIPAEAQAFEMCQLPENSYSGAAAGTLTPVFHIAVFARSMVPGDKLSYDVTYVWESEMGQGNAAEETGGQVVPVPPHELTVAGQKAKPYAAANTSNIHALPWVETLAQTRPASLNMALTHPSVPQSLRPGKPTSLYAAPEKSFLGKVADAAKGALSGVAKTHMLQKVPYVGGVLDTAANWLSSLFD